MRAVNLLILASLLVSPCSAGLAQSASRARRIDSLALDAVESHRLSSVAIAVVDGRDTVVLRAWGEAAREPRRGADARTVYRLASLTKQFTAAMILQLVAERRLALDDTLGQYLPWVPVAWRSVKVAQLLNHTSGIPSYTSLGRPWIARWAEEMVPDTIIALTSAQPLDFAPGSSWRYDNTGYVILGRIIEILDGRPYAASVAARLATPLGLTTLRYCPTDPVPPRDAVGYESAPGGTFRPAARLALTQPFAAGGLCAAAADLVRWNVALHGGRVVTPELYARMTTPEGAAREHNYGFGIGRDTSQRRLRFTHSGGINGFATSNSYWPARSLSVVVLANTEGNEVDALAEQVRRVLFDEPLVPRARRIALTAEQLAPHAGQYELTLPSRSINLTVSVERDHLMAAFDGDSPTEMVPIGPHRFMAAQDQSLQLAFEMTNGRITGVVLESGPQKFVGRRK